MTLDLDKLEATAKRIRSACGMAWQDAQIDYLMDFNPNAVLELIEAARRAEETERALKLGGKASVRLVEACDDYRADLAVANARIAELESALKPFADTAAYLNDCQGRAFRVAYSHTAGDIRAAARALAKKETTDV